MGYSPWRHKESDTSEATEPVHMHSISHTKPQFWYQQKDSCSPLGHRSESALAVLAVSGPSGSGKTQNPKWHLLLGKALHTQLVPTEVGCQVFPYSLLRFHLNIIPIMTLSSSSFFFWPHCPAYGNLSSSTRDQTCAPCSGRQSPNHWTTREVPELFFCTR